MLAHQDQGKADQRLAAARESLKQLPAMLEQDRGTQIEIVPRTSQRAAQELANLGNQYDELQVKLEQNRTHSDRANSAQAEANRKLSEFNNHIRRLSDLSLPEVREMIELPDDEVRTLELVNEKISGLQTLQRSATTKTLSCRGDILQSKKSRKKINTLKPWSCRLGAFLLTCLSRI